MACRQDSEVNVSGDWVRITNQGPPPNAVQADRNQAQTSADVAANAAGNLHCSAGNSNCPANSTCSATAWGLRTYTFEDGKFVNFYYIRCTVVALFECECTAAAEGGEQEEESNGDDPEQTPEQTPQQAPQGGVEP